MKLRSADARGGASDEALPLGWRFARYGGWALIAAGGLILLYLAYLLVFTNFQTDAAQARLLDTWELEVGPIEPNLGAASTTAGQQGSTTDPPIPADPGEAYAVMWFTRPGGERIVHRAPLLVVEGVDLADLQHGPGHYPDTAAPGTPGNFAVAGHRTTYGAPFYHLDGLQPGDEVHVLDRRGREFVYEVVESRIVPPGAGWVLRGDPLGLGRPMLTLTTCHPRFSAAKRLVVFATLRTA